MIFKSFTSIFCLSSFYLLANFSITPFRTFFCHLFSTHLIIQLVISHFLATKTSIFQLFNMLGLNRATLITEFFKQNVRLLSFKKQKSNCHSSRCKQTHFLSIQKVQVMRFKLFDCDASWSFHFAGL